MLRSLSLLDYALLGLAADDERSGYDLRRLMHTTPLVTYSDSPGSVYPALRRLEEHGLLRGGAEAGGRHRRVLRLTPRGRRRLVEWLDEPITIAEARRGDGAMELKLSLMDGLHPKRRRAFIREWAEASAAFALEIAAAEREMGSKLSGSARLALGLGLCLVRARARYLAKACRPAVRPRN